MNETKHRNLSIRGPLTLFIIVLVLISTLTVLWNVVLVHDYNKLRELAAQDTAFHGTFLALGSLLFLTIIVLSSILGAQLIGQLRWSQRQSNFIASVSHELNSPLSAIKLFAQTLRRDDLSTGDRRNFVEKILFDVERLSRLVANILRAAEVDNRGAELLIAPQRVELHSYLDDYLEDAVALHRENGLAMSLAGKGPLWVELDRMMFRQVLDNLVDNAVRYRGERPPKIHVEVAPLDGKIEIRVSDQGIGVPAAELVKLFDRFYRIETGEAPRRGRKGTGIGLYIVRTIVHAHGGKVGARSEGPGKGTTIWIRLPAAEAEEEAA
ncbi:MAG: HAMP domain-containing histidine kinase [Thermoanaerobaculia bacterium]|nr:HAMP domain-containing histidine kinase [Thermoanaerobaculia bacterium]